MELNANSLTIFHKPWFHGTPQNAKKANAILSFDGVLSDTETLVIGNNTYEFDYTDAVTAGRIKADMTAYLTKAKATLTYEGIPVVTKTVTIGANDDLETYEMVADAGDIADEGNIPVVLGETLTADNAVVKLAQAINANSALVTAISNTTTDTVVITAKAGGTGANTIAVATTETNASFGGGIVALSGGLNTCTDANAALCVANVINSNVSEVVTATVGTNGTSVVIASKVVGTEGNNIAISTTCANGSLSDNATKLSGGQYAIPCNASTALIIINNTIYFTVKPCDRFTENAWYSCSTTAL